MKKKKKSLNWYHFFSHRLQDLKMHHIFHFICDWDTKLINFKRGRELEAHTSVLKKRDEAQ